MSALTDSLIEQLGILLASASDIKATEHRAFELQIIAAVGLLESRLRGNNIFTGELNGGAPNAALGIEGDLYVAEDSFDFFTFEDGEWVFLFNPKPAPSAFLPVAANAYGSHPAFSSQLEWNIWLTQHLGSGTVPVTPLPTITAFLPISGARGSTVVITGTNFTGASVVSINSGAVASFTVNSATQITAVLSNSQATGLVRVTTPGGTAVSSSSFTVTSALPPSISGASPNNGAVGDVITLNGARFATPTAFALNGVAITAYTVVSASVITFTVPAGATTGIISLTTADGTATSSGSFTVTVPAGRVQVQSDGDSLMSGYLSTTEATYGGTPPNTSPLGTLYTRLGTTNYGDFRSWAKGGEELTQMLARQATQITTRDTSTYVRGVLLAGGGHNDLFHGATVAQALARYQQYVQQAVAAGWRVIVETKSASYFDFNAFAGYGPTIDQMAALCLEFNRRIRALWQTWGASGLVDFAADTHIGVFHTDHAFDATYYNTDGLHLKDFGYAYKGLDYEPAVVAVGNGGTYGVVTPYVGNPDTGPVTLITENVVWTDLVNTTASGNTLQMAGGSAYRATGHSSKEIGASTASTRGILAWDLDHGDGESVSGLNSQDTGSSYSDIELGFAIYNGQIRPFGPNTPNNGNNTTGFVAFADGDVASIKVNANSVQWLLNSTVLFSILYAPTGPLFVDTSFATVGAKVRNVRISGAVLTTRTPTNFFIEDDDPAMSGAYAGPWNPNNDVNFRGAVGKVLTPGNVGTVTVTLLNVRGFRLWEPGGPGQIAYRDVFSYTINGGAVVNATQAINNPSGATTSWPYYASPLESVAMDMTIVFTFPSSTAVALWDGIEGIY